MSELTDTLRELLDEGRTIDAIRLAAALEAELAELRAEHDSIASGRVRELYAKLEAELAGLRELRKKIDWLPTAWRAQSLDFPVDGAPLYPSVLLACADELEGVLAILDAQPPQEPVCGTCGETGFVMEHRTGCWPTDARPCPDCRKEQADG